MSSALQEAGLLTQRICVAGRASSCAGVLKWEAYLKALL